MTRVTCTYLLPDALHSRKKLSFRLCLFFPYDAGQCYTHLTNKVRNSYMQSMGLLNCLIENAKEKCISRQFWKGFLSFSKPASVALKSIRVEMHLGFAWLHRHAFLFCSQPAHLKPSSKIKQKELYRSHPAVLGMQLLLP